MTPDGMYLRTPFESHVGMMNFDGGAFDRSQPLTRDHVESVLRRISGTEVSISDLHLASTFTDRAMQAPAYRMGRILLAGDAAHIHSPLGGQGLNLGIGDALNLGWKLAATVQGHAAAGLLNTFEAERRPVGAAVLDWSRTQVAAMHPGHNTPALRKLLFDLMNTRCGATHVYRVTSGLFAHYDLGGRHPIVGTTAPEFRLAGGTRLGELMREGRGIVLDVPGHRALRDAADGRPDGIVVWASAGVSDTDTFAQSATRWFGHPNRGGIG